MTALNKHAQLRKELSNPAIGSKDQLRKLAKSLLDDLEAKEEQRANWFQMAQKLGEDLDVAEKRIAELEAREVTLPQPAQWDISEVLLDKVKVVSAIRSAGIGVKGD
ncbi:hypothetical protein ACOAAE_000648 [Citrobacter freundii]